MNARARAFGRIAAALAAGLCLAPLGIARAQAPLVVDADDDDDDRVPDFAQALVRDSAELRFLPLGAHAAGAEITLTGPARLLADGRPVASGEHLARDVQRLAVQATASGSIEVVVAGAHHAFHAIGLVALDGAGARVDLTRGHASFARRPPARLAADPALSDGDPDALRYVVVGRADDLPAALAIHSYAASGAPLGVLTDVALTPLACDPVWAGVSTGEPDAPSCRASAPIRVVADDIDSEHPVAARRSIVGELGGVLVVARAHRSEEEGQGPVLERADKLGRLRVGAPRIPIFAGLERLRASLRVVLVRLNPGGAAPIGGDDATARTITRASFARASQLWGACGISFGPERELAIEVVDPPPSHLLAVGCDQGLPARRDGVVSFALAGERVSVPFQARELPRAVARRIAAELGARGLRAVVSDNPPIGAATYGASDVLVRLPNGALANLALAPEVPLSSDPDFGVCLGAVDLDDGLQHFGDVDAVAGTIEERTLLKAFDDGDPRTIDIVVVPGFARGGRIGESFILADGGALRNAIVVDRGGIQANRASFTIAHELGHVLLDDPGHPDDYGLDATTELMDADAANPSAFGPRRLSLDECARALRQSGPGAAVPLLAPWPFERLRLP